MNKNFNVSQKNINFCKAIVSTIDIYSIDDNNIFLKIKFKDKKGNRIKTCLEFKFSNYKNYNFVDKSKLIFISDLIEYLNRNLENPEKLSEENDSDDILYDFKEYLDNVHSGDSISTNDILYHLTNYLGNNPSEPFCLDGKRYYFSNHLTPKYGFSNYAFNNINNVYEVIDNEELFNFLKNLEKGDLIVLFMAGKNIPDLPEIISFYEGESDFFYNKEKNYITSSSVLKYSQLKRFIITTIFFIEVIAIIVISCFIYKEFINFLEKQDEYLKISKYFLLYLIPIILEISTNFFIPSYVIGSFILKNKISKTMRKIGRKIL